MRKGAFVLVRRSGPSASSGSARSAEGSPRRDGSRVMAMWAALLLGAAAAAAGASDIPDCPDQAAALLPRAERLISEFSDESIVAMRTPRVSLAAGISRLRAIWRETLGLPQWPEDRCGFRLRERLDAAESYDIQRLERFMATSQRTGSLTAEELWADVNRALRALRELVEATRN